MNVDDKLFVLKNFSNNLENISFDLIFASIRNLGLNNLCCTNIPAGFKIFRATPSNGVDFTNIKRISYNPNPKKYNRANRVGFPMFYGTFPIDINSNPITLFGTNCFEIIEILRNHPNNLKSDKVNLTLGIWKVKKKLPVISIIFNDKLIEKSPDFFGLQKFYKASLKNNPDDIKIMQFFSEEFSKINIQKDTDYKLSAAFAEFLFQNNPNGIEALIYPSVRLGGEGYNIALTPNFVESFLIPEKVFTLDIYIENDKIAFDLIKESAVNVITGDINLMKSQDPNSNIGEHKIKIILDKI
jgi:hypothetical protein